MSFTVIPTGETLGARITGIDLRRPLDPAALDGLWQAWRAHMVLIFPGQELTDAEQRDFAAQFGPLGVRRRAAEDRPEGRDADHVMLITNIRENGVPIGSLPDGEMYFHHDMCYQKAPHIGTMLYAIEIPSWGGNTLFANMYKAYETLPGDLKEKIEGRRVVQVYNYLPTVRVAPDADFSRYNHYVQPAVIVHPGTGKKALYVNQLMSTRIQGMSVTESEEVLEALRTHIGRPENVYAHEWTPGDLLMWDNLCTCHARTDFPENETRLLRRCTVSGDPLIPA